MNSSFETEKMGPICNIQQMQRMIGMEETKLNKLMKLPYDALHEMQNGLIAMYNEAVIANKKKQ